MHWVESETCVMSGSSSSSQRLVDTVALAALANTSKRDLVFSEVPMAVTRCCFQELDRGADDADDPSYRQGCSRAIDLIQARKSENIELVATGLDCKNRYGRLYENIGEKTIARALEMDQSYQLVVSFDDDVLGQTGGVSDELKQMFRQSIPQFKVFPVNEPLYRLLNTGDIDTNEFVEETEQLINEMGWSDAAYVDRFWNAYPENFPR